jgi:hypothetical protein
VAPEGAPEWFTTLFAEFARNDIGISFDDLLRNYATLEAAYGWDMGGKKALSAAKRPKLLDNWIKEGRIRAPDMSKGYARFSKDFIVWYRSIQPSWRQWKNESLTPPKNQEYGNDWDSLNVPG